MKSFIRALLMMMLLSIGLTANAQASPPDEINDAIENLSIRLSENITLNTLDSYEWEARTFSDASLDCPQPGTAYAQVVTDGYRFLLEYQDTTYDYRVAENGTAVILCNQGNSGDVELQNPCGDSVTVNEGDTLFAIAQRCNTTVNALVAANENIVTANDTIFAGDTILIPSPDAVRLDESSVIAIYPLSGPAGSQVTVIVNGFPANANVQLGLGVPNSEYTLTRTERTDAFGGLITQMTIPADSDNNQSWVIVATLSRTTDEVISNPFYVGAVDNTFEQVNIFMIRTESGGEIGCGDSLVPVAVPVEPTIAPMTAAYEQLLSINEQNYQGHYNALANSDLTLASASIMDGEAMVYLTGTIQLGGTCDTPRFLAQLEQVALQYSTVDSVSIFINDQAIDEVLSAQ